MDPLFIDDENTARVASWTFHFEDSLGIDSADGTFRLRFYDVYGEDWVTEPLSLNATCDTITDELVSIPNDAIDDGTVDCTHDVWTNIAKYTVVFTGNPGYLKVRYCSHCTFYSTQNYPFMSAIHMRVFHRCSCGFADT